MATEFKLPELGENIESGDVTNIMVSEGDTIQADQNVMEIETDKASLELPCPHAGKVAKIHVSEGDTVSIGDLLLTIEAADASPKEEPQEAPPQADAKAEAPEEPEAEKEPAPTKVEKKPEPAPAPVEDEEAVETEEPTVPFKPAPSHVQAAAGPATRRLARELGVDINDVSGTGEHGRITREDVLNLVRQGNNRAKPAPASSGGGTATATKPAAKKTEPQGEADEDNYGPIRRAKLTKIRKTIAANMSRSKTTIPHVTNFDDADITELERIRKGSMADYVGSEIKLTMLAFVLKAVGQALRAHPTLNCSLDLDNDQIIYKDYVNLGIAVDTERGLMVPVIQDVDKLSIPQLAKEITGIAQRARNNKITLEELRGGTFTISNLGAIGGTYSTPVINHPESAILLLGRSRKLPIVMPDDTIQPRLMMPLSLSYDHRTVDGATAGRFLNEVINYLETPGRLLLAP